MSGPIGRGCQKVSKSFPGRKGGAAFLGISPPEALAHVCEDIHIVIHGSISCGDRSLELTCLSIEGWVIQARAKVECYTAGERKGMKSAH